jgi:hypothetical protein
MRKHRSLGFIFSAIYSTLCFLAVSYIVLLITLYPGRFELAGIAIFLLGLPWSLVLAITASTLNLSSAWFLAIGMIASCILNGWLLYKLGSALDSRRK